MAERPSSGRRLELLGRCLALTFKQRQFLCAGPRPNGTADQARAQPGTAYKVRAAPEEFIPREIFEEFREMNCMSFWNVNLEEAIKNICYAGHIFPFTLLIDGEEKYLQTIKVAWIKRLLRSPKDFRLIAVGDLASGIAVAAVPQTQFIPLDEAVCFIIHDLNCSGHNASQSAVRDRLRYWYRDMQMPDDTVLLSVLDMLVAENKIYLTANGYCIMSPDKAHVAAWISSQFTAAPLVTKAAAMDASGGHAGPNSTNHPLTSMPSTPAHLESLQQQQQQQQQQQPPLVQVGLSGTHAQAHNQSQSQPNLAGTSELNSNTLKEHSIHLPPSGEENEEYQMPLMQYNASATPAHAPGHTHTPSSNTTATHYVSTLQHMQAQSGSSSQSLEVHNLPYPPPVPPQLNLRYQNQNQNPYPTLPNTNAAAPNPNIQNRQLTSTPEHSLTSNPNQNPSQIQAAQYQYQFQQMQLDERGTTPLPYPIPNQPGGYPPQNSNVNPSMALAQGKNHRSHRHHGSSKHHKHAQIPGQIPSPNLLASQNDLVFAAAQTAMPGQQMMTASSQMGTLTTGSNMNLASNSNLNPNANVGLNQNAQPGENQQFTYMQYTGEGLTTPLARQMPVGNNGPMIQERLGQSPISNPDIDTNSLPRVIPDQAMAMANATLNSNNNASAPISVPQAAPVAPTQSSSALSLPLPTYPSRAAAALPPAAHHIAQSGLTSAHNAHLVHAQSQHSVHLQAQSTMPVQLPVGVGPEGIPLYSTQDQVFGYPLTSGDSAIGPISGCGTFTATGSSPNEACSSQRASSLTGSSSSREPSTFAPNAVLLDRERQSGSLKGSASGSNRSRGPTLSTDALRNLAPLTQTLPNHPDPFAFANGSSSGMPRF